jgi:hypothetical protein
MVMFRLLATVLYDLIAASGDNDFPQAAADIAMLL